MYKISYIINKLNRGGAEKNLYQIITNLPSSNKYSIYTLFGPGDYEAPFRKRGISIVNLNLRGSLLSPRNYFKYLRLIKEIRDQKPNLIHSFLFKSNVVNMMLRIFSPGTKTIVTKMGSNFWYKWYHFLINRFVYRYSDLIMVNTSALKSEISNYTSSDNKIRVINNGIDTSVRIEDVEINELIRPIRESGKFIIGSIGRFVSEKRYDDIIEAAKLLIVEHQNIHFVFVGGRGRFDEYREKVISRDLQEYITFTGEVDNVFSYIKGFDVVLLASSSEGMPNVIMEAMLLGKAIIATMVGGIPELVEDEVNGFLIPPFNPEKIADALRKMMENGNLLYKMRENNLRKIQEFSIENMALKVHNMYQELMLSESR